MNTIIFQTIRVATIALIAFFAFVSDVLAAPMLTPVAVKDISSERATIVGHVSNPYKSSTVWFEVSNNYGAPTVYATQGIWHEGTFQWNLENLIPGQIYTVRSVAMEGGTTTYAPFSSFTTYVAKKVVPATITYQTNDGIVTRPLVKSKDKEEKPIITKIATTTVATSEGFTNRNTASVIGAGDSIYPKTLIGWVSLLLAILLAVLIGHMIYQTPERRLSPRVYEDNTNGDEKESEE